MPPFQLNVVFNGWADSSTVKQCGIPGPKAQTIFRKQEPLAGGRKYSDFAYWAGKPLNANIPVAVAEDVPEPFGMVNVNDAIGFVLSLSAARLMVVE